MSASILSAISFNDIKEIDVSAKRWFQSSYGNTYHSVLLSVFDGKKWTEIAVNPFEYGYGDHYMHTALRLLKDSLSDKEIDINQGMYTLTRFCKVNDIQLHDTVIDVKRKKDL